MLESSTLIADNRVFPCQRGRLIKKAFGCITEGSQSSCKRCGGETAVRIFLWNHGVYSTNSAPGQNDSSR